MTAHKQPAAGWYPNPDGSGGQRYWNGHKWTDMPAPPAAPAAAAPAKSNAQRYEYKVETIRETLVGDKIKHSALENQLNARARDGWQVKSIVHAPVSGRVGPGGTGGLLVVFERDLL